LVYTSRSSEGLREEPITLQNFTTVAKLLLSAKRSHCFPKNAASDHLVRK